MRFRLLTLLLATAACSGGKESQAAAADSVAKAATLRAALDTLAVAMPRNLAAIKTRLDEIDQSKQLPQGIDPLQVQAAKDTYAAATEAWPGIMSQAQSGDLTGAMAKALGVKTRVTQSLQALGLTSDERAWTNATPAPKP